MHWPSSPAIKARRNLSKGGRLRPTLSVVVVPAGVHNRRPGDHTLTSKVQRSFGNQAVVPESSGAVLGHEREAFIEDALVVDPANRDGHVLSHDFADRLPEALVLVLAELVAIEVSSHQPNPQV